jgi:uncharacterized protein Veg
MATKKRQNSAVLEGKVRYARESQAVVFDDFIGLPLKVTFLGGRLWMTTPGEKLQPLDEWMGDDTISFTFLCEAGGKVGALTLAKMLGNAVEVAEGNINETMHRCVKGLKRLGVKLDVKDEALLLELRTFSNEGTYRCEGKYTVMCNALNDGYDSLFDVDNFDNKGDAERWAYSYFDFLESLGIDFKVI